MATKLTPASRLASARLLEECTDAGADLCARVERRLYALVVAQQRETDDRKEREAALLRDYADAVQRLVFTAIRTRATGRRPQGHPTERAEPPGEAAAAATAKATADAARRRYKAACTAALRRLDQAAGASATIRCRRCKTPNPKWRGEQRRGGDEGTTNIFTCRNPRCGHEWTM
jgi:DNA-directed RNA polymerase subunit M/transcription elongation factor TFIIS